MLAHMVYFTLKDHSAAGREALIAAARTWLTGHDGTAFFGVGTCADYDRDVNDRDYDVALCLVFKDRAAHDAYQVAPRHKEFIAAMRDNWQRVRVFDADVD